VWITYGSEAGAREFVNKRWEPCTMCKRFNVLTRTLRSRDDGTRNQPFLTFEFRQAHSSNQECMITIKFYQSCQNSRWTKPIPLRPWPSDHRSKLQKLTSLGCPCQKVPGCEPVSLCTGKQVSSYKFSVYCTPHPHSGLQLPCGEWWVGGGWFLL
jgi:hypothetical protein